MRIYATPHGYRAKAWGVPIEVSKMRGEAITHAYANISPKTNHINGAFMLPSKHSSFYLPSSRLCPKGPTHCDGHLTPLPHLVTHTIRQPYPITPCERASTTLPSPTDVHSCTHIHYTERYNVPKICNKMCSLSRNQVRRKSLNILYHRILFCKLPLHLLVPLGSFVEHLATDSSLVVDTSTIVNNIFCLPIGLF